MAKWWQEAVIYQIYPRSFNDFNGDGIGDIPGIIAKADYLESLGVDVVWLSPIFESPNQDMGYDISDYYRVMPEFGKMADFDQLLEALHSRNIKVILDLVVNHTSDEHYWFRQARRSRDNPFRDFYHWWPAEKGPPPKRHSFFDENSNAWAYDAKTDAYYLHLFSKHQPDLNWDNKAVRQRIYQMMHFWLLKGVDGFRMDVISYISKDNTYPEPPQDIHESSWEAYHASGPNLEIYLHEMKREVLCKYDIVTLAEAPGLGPEDISRIVDKNDGAFNLAYHFDHTNIGLLPRKLIEADRPSLLELKNVYDRWIKALSKSGWGTTYFGNHDQPRMVTRWGNDRPEWREKSSKLLNTFLLTMPGTPLCYQGDEIAMSNIKFERICQYRDLETINWFHQIKSEGGDTQGFLEAHKIVARDNGRTPMQWDDREHGGFSETQPWISSNPDHATVNVAAQEQAPDGGLEFFKRLVRLRKSQPALRIGSFQWWQKEHTSLFGFIRSYGSTEILVLLNFSDNPISMMLDEPMQVQSTLSTNDDHFPIQRLELSLKPWQAWVGTLAPNPPVIDRDAIQAQN